MPRLSWSPPSLLDIQRLYRFLAANDKGAASRAVTTIKKSANVLLLQPGIGRPVDDLPENFRELVIEFGGSGYVARYRLDAENVTILAIRHQKEVGFLAALVD